MFTPTLTRKKIDGIDVLTDTAAAELGVCIAFLGREGGVSTGPYRSLNLALRSDDDPSRVTENRRRAAAALGFDPEAIALAHQVHGARVLDVDAGRSGSMGEADGLVTRHKGVVLAVMTADCAPVILAGSSGVAMLHAGWRGVVAGVVERGLEMVGDVWGAWVGPSIHACCYEVGPEVMAAWDMRELPSGDGASEAEPRRGEGGCVDPALAAAYILKRAGVEQVAVASECTNHFSGYFSYRRDGVTGRQGAFAWLE